MNVIAKVCAIVNGFIGPDNRGIFSHKPKSTGELCHVCQKPMSSGITQVGSGQRMHGECWSAFFHNRVEELKKKYAQRRGTGAAE